MRHAGIEPGSVLRPKTSSVPATSNMKTKPSILALALIFALVPLKAPAQVIVSSTGNFDGWVVIYSGQAFGVSWSQSIAYDDVSVSVSLTAFGHTSETGRAFLSTTIGPGASPTGQVAYTTFAFPSAENDVLLFSGLSLSPGQYYLSLVGDSPSWGSGWILSSPPTFETGTGVTLGSSYGFSSPGLSYLPSSGVYAGGSITNFAVTGTAIPEPSTWGILAAGSALVLVSFRRRTGQRGLGSRVQA